MPNTVAEAPLIDPAEIDEDYLHVVAAIIWRDSEQREFLIARRQKGKHLQDYWELPGGKLEAGEVPRQALARELHEEIGIRPSSASPYMRVYYRYSERNILLDTWLVAAYRGEVEPREQQELAWIGVGQIDDYRFPPADLPILEKLRQSK